MYNITSLILILDSALNAQILPSLTQYVGAY